MKIVTFIDKKGIFCRDVDGRVDSLQCANQNGSEYSTCSIFCPFVNEIFQGAGSIEFQITCRYVKTTIFVDPRRKEE